MTDVDYPAKTFMTTHRIKELVAKKKDLVSCDQKTTVEEVNAAFKKAAQSTLRGILDVSDEPLVSSDYMGSTYSSVVDAMSTQVIDGNLVHVSSWYDNEMGYSARCVDLLAYLASQR